MQVLYSTPKVEIPDHTRLGVPNEQIATAVTGRGAVYKYSFPPTPDSSMVELPEARVFVVGSNPTLVVIKWVARNGRRTCPKPYLKGRKRAGAPERRGGLLEWRNW